MTNADKIRNMKDEEIAFVLHSMNTCDRCPARNFCDEHNEIETFFESLVGWLKERETA